ncbi:MAG: ABC transporter substrate-binding protein [Lachnospiraceae bacterium]
MKIKKIAALLVAGVMAAGVLAGCGGSEDTVGSVYYLSFKPEQAEQWEAIAKQYTEETGVEVKVSTAASGTYEQTLKSEISKKSAPTLFQINGPVGYQAWKDYCLDLSDTDLYSWLKEPEMAVTGEDGGVYGIPYVVEGYGIIYNNEIMDAYFALDGAKATSMEEINSFATLSAVVEDMTAKKDALGIEGVFASTSFSPGEDWRWQTHLMNLPIYYEYRDAGVSDEEEITFSYNENYKNIFDLYINNSVTEPAMLGSKSVEDSMAEFALGKAAMVQNGNWGWGQVSGVSGNVVKEDQVKFLPIYTGVEGEEEQGLCTGTENFFSVNSEASEADQQASIDFVEWLFSSDEGKVLVRDELGFISPFTTFTEEDNPTDPLAQEVVRYMDNSDLYSVSWNFTSFPSQTFKDNLGAELLDYASGNVTWDALVSATIEDWATEKAATAE